MRPRNSNSTAHQRPGLYRARNGVFFGVCRGLAEYFHFSVTGVRVAFVVGTLFTGVWPMIAAYALAALLMPVAPVLPLDNDADAEFYNSYSASREMALLRLKHTYERLDRRIQRIESVVTNRGYDWEQRLHKSDQS